jgi:hypothetical protein
MTSLALEPATARPWGRAALWLLGLGPLFYLSYGFANWLASTRADVPAVVFEWERAIPFWRWTIIPYWSINVFYAASLFVCRTPDEVDTHGRRLLTVQVVCVTCFLLAPLRFSFPRPETGSGPLGFLFDALLSFDKPFNQAPSLHIALLVVLWDLYSRHVGRRLRWLLDAWSLLIGFSVLTTYQHHFVDIPTGILAGVLCLWIWPWQERSPLSLAGISPMRRHRRIAVRYAAGAGLLALVAARTGGAGLWLLWPTLSLLLVAASYAALGVAGFQKSQDGRATLASLVLLAPYRWAAWVNSRLWTWRAPEPVMVSDEVWLGRLPGRRDRQPFVLVVDLCAELIVPRSRPVRAFPVLDLTAPEADLLAAAAAAIERGRQGGPVLVCCALGYSRSAAAVAAWLLATGREQDADAAIARVRAARPAIVLGHEARRAIAAAAGGSR